MSCNLHVKITKGKELIDSFYANLNVRDLVINDNEIFGWTNDDEFVRLKEDECYTEITTTADNVLSTCDKYKFRYLDACNKLLELKISRLAVKSKSAYNGLSDDIFEASKIVDEYLKEWTNLLSFYHSIILLADKKCIYDYSSLKIHMYLG